MNIREEQYFLGISMHEFKAGDTFLRYRKILKDIYNGDLKENYYFENKYEATEDLRPEAYNYDDSVIDVLIESGVHKKMIDIFGYELFLSQVQIRISHHEYQNDLSYMPWHRDTYLYEDGKVIGNVPPVKKIIYYPKFDNIKNDCLMFAAGSHLNIKHNKQEDLAQLNTSPIIKVPASTNKFFIFNTDALHNAIPPQNERQARVVYSFCPIGQVDHHKNHDLHKTYLKRLDANLHK